MNYLVGFQQKHRNCVLEYICCSSPSHSMASASSRPARATKRGHIYIMILISNKFYRHQEYLFVRGALQAAEEGGLLRRTLQNNCESKRVQLLKASFALDNR